MTVITVTNVQLGPAAVELAITAAPAPPTDAYASNFTAGTDSFSGSGTGVTLTNDTTTDPDSLHLTGPGLDAGPVTAARVVTGLTIGAVYTLRAFVTKTQGTIRLAVKEQISGDPILTGSYVAPTFGRTALRLVFTATAADVVIMFDIRNPNHLYADGPEYHIDTITLTPSGTWLGTTVTRTDANGTDVEVRENQGGQDVSALGSMALTDYECALTGLITYTVTDGLGGTAQTTATFDTVPDVKPSLTIPVTAVPGGGPGSDPDFVEPDMVLTYDETSQSNGTLHTIIARADKVANPGPLALRSGALDVFCLDYAQAKAVRDLLATGEVAMLRQPTHPGMDLYFTARAVAVRPESTPTETRRWVASVAYEEGLAP